MFRRNCLDLGPLVKLTARMVDAQGSQDLRQAGEEPAVVDGGNGATSPRVVVCAGRGVDGCLDEVDRGVDFWNEQKGHRDGVIDHQREGQEKGLQKLKAEEYFTCIFKRQMS